MTYLCKVASGEVIVSLFLSTAQWPKSLTPFPFIYSVTTLCKIASGKVIFYRFLPMIYWPNRFTPFSLFYSATTLCKLASGEVIVYLFLSTAQRGFFWLLCQGRLSRMPEAIGATKTKAHLHNKINNKNINQSKTTKTFPSKVTRHAHTFLSCCVWWNLFFVYFVYIGKKEAFWALFRRKKMISLEK